MICIRRVLNPLDLTYEIKLCVDITRLIMKHRKEGASLKCASGDSRYLHFTQLE
jgi:hypothetical protein